MIYVLFITKLTTNRLIAIIAIRYTMLKDMLIIPENPKNPKTSATNNSIIINLVIIFLFVRFCGQTSDTKELILEHSSTSRNGVKSYQDLFIFKII